MEDVEFYNLSSAEQTKQLETEVDEIVNSLKTIARRLDNMGATNRALDIKEGIAYIDAAMEG